MLDSILLPPECRGYRHAPDFMGLWGKGWRGYVHRSPWSLFQSEHLWMPLLYSLKVCPPSQLCGNSLGDFPNVPSSNRGGRQGRKEPKEPKVLALLAPPPPFTTACMYHSPWWSQFPLRDLLHMGGLHTSPRRSQESSPPSSFRIPKSGHNMLLLLAPTQCPIYCGFCTLPMLWRAILLLGAIAIKQIEGTICFLL